MAKLVTVPPDWAASARISRTAYTEAYSRSVHDNEAFWANIGRRLHWTKPYTQIKDVDFTADVRIRWYYDGQLNACENCIDRHLATRGHQTAIIFEGDDPTFSSRYTFRDLHQQVCRLANVLKALNVKKGDRVIIYLPTIPEAVFAMLACARIGAVHSVVLTAVSPEAIADRIDDAEAALVITADAGLRARKLVPLKASVDLAIKKARRQPNVLVYRHTGTRMNLVPRRDFVANELLEEVADTCPAEPMDAEAPLFILYTSGATGKPKGVLHTTGGYLVYASYTHELVFDPREGDVHWCTADAGWITGHTYSVYGPLANGMTTVLFEGVPNYPDASRLWQIVDKHSVNTFYTAPTVIRSLMRFGEAPVRKTSRASLRLLGSVGESIHPDAWKWYYDVVGNGRCPIVDTWWQTETGGILISPLPGATDLKPGSATRPLLGIKPAIVDGEGRRLEGPAHGHLVLIDSWPGQIRTIHSDHAHFVKTYFSRFPGVFFTGDGARRDEDGYYWITGRVDDVLNVCGHRMGAAEIEGALVAHPSVLEAAVVGFPHAIKGEGIYAFVLIMGGIEPNDALRSELRQWVTEEIGAMATPDRIQWAAALPKTRSGKIMRRVLRQIAARDGVPDSDTTTLADPTVVQTLIEGRLKRPL